MNFRPGLKPKGRIMPKKTKTWPEGVCCLGCGLGPAIRNTTQKVIASVVIPFVQEKKKLEGDLGKK